MLWNDDLDEFITKLDEVEAKEREEAAALVSGKAGKSKGKKNQNLKQEAMPSPHGIRVAPKIPDEMRSKAAAAARAKDRKESKAAKKLDKEMAEVDDDEFDTMINDKDKRR